MKPHQRKNMHIVNNMHIWMPGVSSAGLILLMYLNSPLLSGAHWVATPFILPLFSVDLSAVHYPTDTIFYLLLISLRPISSHFCSFLCRFLHSPLPLQPPWSFYLQFFRHLITSNSSSSLCRPIHSLLSSPTPFIVLLTNFPLPHNPSPSLNTLSRVLYIHLFL